MTLCQLAYTVAYTVARAATAGKCRKRCRCGSETVLCLSDADDGLPGTIKKFKKTTKKFRSYENFDYICGK